MIRLLFSICLCCFSITLLAQAQFSVQSPNKKLSFTLHVENTLLYSIQYNGNTIVSNSPIALQLKGGKTLGKKPKLDGKPQRNSVRETWTPIVYKKASIEEAYEELILPFKGGYQLHLRAYDAGVAYRFSTQLEGEIEIEQEQVSIRFQDNAKLTAMPSEKYHDYESVYKNKRIDKLKDSKILLPFVVHAEGYKLAITEADLYDYPGLYFKRDATQVNSLTSDFPNYPNAFEIGGVKKFNQLVKGTEDFMARTEGTRTFPWRVFILAAEDKELLNNDLVYLLSRKVDENTDFSWVKPGKVAWDWWSDMNLYNVDFEAGINTATYMYYIDFAAANGIEYINLDEGWSDQYDLLDVSEEIDVQAIIDYAKSKNVGVILWCVARVLDKQMEEFMDAAQAWGAKGLKVDFMDRDDQLMVDFYERCAKAAAARQLIINYHGAYKPTGMNRAYPNILNHEAVRGLEYSKFNKEGATPEQAVTIPFLRMLSGYMDYTPGAMRNAARPNWRMIWSQPMSKGTRCHQMAMYVMYEAPLLMLADMPTAYEQEPTILNALKTIPTTWDETRAIDGKIGEYAVIARRRGDTWYIAGMTNWEERTLSLDLSFLSKDTYQMELFKDGINANRVGRDYIRETGTLENTNLDIQLKQGGGFLLKLTR